jgi:hypothetical protein
VPFIFSFLASLLTIIFNIIDLEATHAKRHQRGHGRGVDFLVSPYRSKHKSNTLRNDDTRKSPNDLEPLPLAQYLLKSTSVGLFWYQFDEYRNKASSVVRNN